MSFHSLWFPHTIHTALLNPVWLLPISHCWSPPEVTNISSSSLTRLWQFTQFATPSFTQLSPLDFHNTRVKFSFHEHMPSPFSRQFPSNLQTSSKCLWNLPRSFWWLSLFLLLCPKCSLYMKPSFYLLFVCLILLWNLHCLRAGRFFANCVTLVSSVWLQIVELNMYLLDK